MIYKLYKDGTLVGGCNDAEVFLNMVAAAVGKLPTTIGRGTYVQIHTNVVLKEGE